VELLFGILHEGALDIDDVLDRRVRLGLVPSERRRAEGMAVQLFAGVAA
jgi:glycerol-3-phosphate dehydrogenase